MIEKSRMNPTTLKQAIFFALNLLPCSIFINISPFFSAAFNFQIGDGVIDIFYVSINYAAERFYIIYAFAFLLYKTNIYNNASMSFIINK